MSLDAAYTDPTQEYLRSVARRLDAALHGEREAILLVACVSLACSRGTLYRRLREVGRTSGRKVRKDAGTFAASDEVLMLISGLQKVGVRKNGKAVMKIPTAKSILLANGVPVDASDSAIARALRAKKLDIRSMQRSSPAVEQRSKHPNYIHQVDPSLCLLFYLRGKQHIIEEDEFYKNKLEAVAKNPLKVWRYVLADHYSSAITVRYYERAGEDQQTLADFLFFAWSQVEGRVTHGVPDFLMMDPGSANTAHSIKNLLGALDVHLLVNLPKGPRAKGSVEVSNNIVETSFESRLKVTPVSCVAELNERAIAWMAAFNDNRIAGHDTRLTRDGLRDPIARYALYRTIKAEQLRLLPPLETCLRLMHGKPIERKVDGELRVSFAHPRADRTQRYDVRGLAGVNKGDTVIVKPLAYGLCAVLIEARKYDGATLTYRLEPISDFNEAGFRESSPVIGEEYKALPYTDIDRNQKALDRAAYGITPDGEIRDLEAIAKAKAGNKVVPFAHLNAGNGLDAFSAFKQIEHPLELPKRGTPIVPAVAPLTQPQGTYMEEAGLALNVPDHMSVSIPKLDHVQMARELLRRLGNEWTPDRFAWLVETWPDGCAEEELPQIADRVRRMGRMQIVK